MSTKKKVVISFVSTLLVLVAIFATTLAVSADDGDITPTATTIMERVAELYKNNTGFTLDPGQLQAAFNEAHQEVREQNRNTMLERLIENGVITEEEATDLREWINEKPDIDFGGLKSRTGQFFEKMKASFGNLHGHTGFGKFGGFGGQCPNTAE